MGLTSYFELMRVKQWYKNLVIFLALIFLEELFIVDLGLKVLIGFISLCLISSANYVINDIFDAKKDKLHPEKKYRPIASGKISVSSAVIFSIILIVSSLLIANSLGKMFVVCVLFLFVFTFIYSKWLKNQAIADILSIAINFVVRAISGAAILGASISPWLVLCPFFLALFLASAKRESDLMLLKGNAKNHRAVLEYYTLEITNALLIITASGFIVVYTFFVLTKSSYMLATIPCALYFILRYYLLVKQGSVVARNPEKLYKDKPIVINTLMWAIIVFALLYYM